MAQSKTKAPKADLQTSLQQAREYQASRKQAARSPNEQVFRSLTDNAGQGLAILQHSGVVYANPAFEQLLGFEPGSLLCASASHVLSAVHPEDRPRVEQEFYNQLQGLSSPSRAELRVVRRDGQVRWIELNAQHILHDELPAVQVVYADITDRKLVEQRLRESQRQLADIIEFLPDPTFVVDAERRVVAWNRALEKLTGIDASRMIGKGDNEYAIPFYGTRTALLVDVALQEEDRATTRYSNLIRDGDTVAAETQKLNVNGKELFLHAKASALRDSTGALVGAIESIRDITERKRTEAALQASEAHYRALFEFTHSGVVVWQALNDGSDFLVKEFNAAAERLHQIPRAEAVGKTLGGLGSTIGDVPRMLSAFQRVLQSGVPESLGLTHLLFPSQEVWIDCFAYKLSSGEVVVQEADVTSDKRMERAILSVATGLSAASGEDFFLQLATTLGKALEVDCVFIAELLPLTTSARTVALWAQGSDWESEEYDLAGSAWESVHNQALWGQPSEAGKAFPNDLLLARWKAEGFIGAQLRDTAGSVVGLLGVLRQSPLPAFEFCQSMVEICALRAGSELQRVRDERDRVRLEQELQQSQKMEAIGRLAGGIAHDFNNLTTCINLTSEMILQSLSPQDPLWPDLKEILAAGKRAARLTQQLLAFSRKQVIAPRVVDLNQTIADSSRMLSRLIGEDIELVVQAASSLGKVRVDPHQIDQVLVNLVVNARDAMPKGGKLIIETANCVLDSLWCRSHPGLVPGDYVTLSVTDTGCGMNRETKLRVFEPFFTTKEKGKGTGLGLATVYGIVQQNHGEIIVESEPGRGSQFKVFLPRAAPGGVANETLAPSPELGGTETILLVEDEDTVRRLAARILRRQGYQILEADRGGDAWLLSKNHLGPIDLLVTDVVLPSMSGRELYQQLIESRPNLRVLFISGYSEDIIAPHGVLEEGTDFLQKPFTIEGLTHKVRAVLDRS